jgi:hypothetical protein
LFLFKSGTRARESEEGELEEWGRVDCRPLSSQLQLVSSSRQPISSTNALCRTVPKIARTSNQPMAVRESVLQRTAALAAKVIGAPQIVWVIAVEGSAWESIARKSAPEQTVEPNAREPTAQ